MRAPKEGFIGLAPEHISTEHAGGPSDGVVIATRSMLVLIFMFSRPGPSRPSSEQTTVPNVFVKGTHVGGNDAVQAANSSGALKTLLDG